MAGSTKPSLRHPIVIYGSLVFLIAGFGWLLGEYSQPQTPAVQRHAEHVLDVAAVVTEEHLRNGDIQKLEKFLDKIVQVNPSMKFTVRDTKTSRQLNIESPYRLPSAQNENAADRIVSTRVLGSSGEPVGQIAISISAPHDAPLSRWLRACLAAIGVILMISGSVSIGVTTFHKYGREDVDGGENLPSFWAIVKNPYQIIADRQIELLRPHQVAAVVRQSGFMLAISAAVGILVVLALVGKVPFIPLAAWLGMMFFLVTVGMLTWRRNRLRPLPLHVSRGVIRRMVRNALIQGSMWGVLFAVFFGSASEGVQLLLIAACLGISAGGVIALAPVPAAALAFAAGALVPTTAGLVLQDDAAYFALAGMAGLYSVAIGILLTQLNDQFVRNLIARMGEERQTRTISLLLREFQDQASDWLWLMDRDQRIVEAPDRMADLLGVMPSRMVGRPLVDLSPDPAAIGWKDLRQTLESRTSFQDLIVETKDLEGETHWIALSANLTSSGIWNGVGSDQTERVATAGELDATRKLLSDAIESLPDGFVIFDQDDMVVMANSSARQEFDIFFNALENGDSMLESIRKSVIGMRPDEDPEIVDFIVKDGLERMQANKSVLTQLADGRFINIAYQAVSGGLRVGISTDVTNIMQSEQQALEAAALLQDATMTIDSGLLATDADLKIVLANDKLPALLDMPAEYFQIGADLRDFVNASVERGDFVRSRTSPVDGKNGSEDTRGLDIERSLPDGRTILSSTRNRIGGGHVVLFTDITSMRDALEQAETASRAKSEFLANMSHELRTPLNPIIGFSEMMLQQAVGPIGTEKYLEYAQHIHTSAFNLYRSVTDVLDLSRIETGELILNEEYLDVCEIVDSVMALANPRAEEAGVELRMTLPEDGVDAMFDARLLKQAINNLLTNSIRFTREAGTINVTVTAPPDADISISIADTGIGIPPSKITACFEPFGQANSAIDRPFDGMGLGLPLSRSSIQLHGGSLDLASVVGEGTTVTVTLPAWRRKRAAASAVRSDQAI